MAARLFVISAIIVNAWLLPSDAMAADGRQKMHYDVYAGGFHVVSADLNVNLSQKSRYTLGLGAYTHGMLAKLAPWQGIFETFGWSGAKSFPQPELHKSVATWRKEVETTIFRYNKNGSFKEYSITNDKEKGVRETDPVLSQNTTDVLSATLMVMNKIAQGGKCEGSSEIFDGSRRYALVYANSKTVDLKGSGLNVYTGPATECTVEVKPITGKWREKPRGWMSIQEQGRAKGTMPTIWFATMAKGEPAVPVKIRVKTDYGTLFMHLTGYEGAGKALSLTR